MPMEPFITELEARPTRGPTHTLPPLPPPPDTQLRVFMRAALAWGWTVGWYLFWAAIFGLDIGIGVGMQLFLESIGRKRGGTSIMSKKNLASAIAKQASAGGPAGAPIPAPSATPNTQRLSVLSQEELLASVLTEHWAKVAMGFGLAIAFRLPQYVLSEEGITFHMLFNLAVMLRCMSLVMLVIRDDMTLPKKEKAQPNGMTEADMVSLEPIGSRQAGSLAGSSPVRRSAAALPSAASPSHRAASPAHRGQSPVHRKQQPASPAHAHRAASPTTFHMAASPTSRTAAASFSLPASTSPAPPAVSPAAASPSPSANGASPSTAGAGPSPAGSSPDPASPSPASPTPAAATSPEGASPVPASLAVSPSPDHAAADSPSPSLPVAAYSNGASEGAAAISSIPG
ncbi:unnamed protein product [Polarella glacialis]|nr:unnamed protein product [Polarella glacialis]